MTNEQLQARLSEYPGCFQVVKPVELFDDDGDLIDVDFEEPDPVRINVGGVVGIAL